MGEKGGKRAGMCPPCRMLAQFLEQHHWFSKMHLQDSSRFFPALLPLALLASNNSGSLMWYSPTPVQVVPLLSLLQSASLECDVCLLLGCGFTITMPYEMSACLIHEMHT